MRVDANVAGFHPAPASLSKNRSLAEVGEEIKTSSGSSWQAMGLNTTSGPSGTERGVGISSLGAQVECPHPVWKGTVMTPGGWKWSSMREYAGVSGEGQERFCELRIDRVPLPFDVHPRI
jgi:hypothetical protein